MVRVKFRYLAGQLLDDHADHQLTESELQSALRDKIVQLFGDCGVGQFGNIAHVKFFDGEKSLFVIRIPRDYFNEIHFALINICEVRKKPLIVRILSVYSCARTCREGIIDICNKYINLDSSTSESEKKSLSISLRNRVSAIDL